MIKKKIAVTLVLTFFIVLSAFALTGYASNKPDNKSENNKYFKSIVIEEGDSLWSIAQEYITDEYDGINDYISELKDMNGLKNDEIHAGEHLIVAYYAKKQ